MSTKVFDGSAFTEGVPKVWNGVAWVPGLMKSWDGAAWIPDAPPPGGFFFEDDFNRSDGPTWGPLWDYTDNGFGIQNILNNHGQRGVGGSGQQNDWASHTAVGSLHTLIEIHLAWRAASGTGNDAWELVAWRSTDDTDGAGRPTDAWQLRRSVNTSNNGYTLRRRINNSEVESVDMGNIGSPLDNQEVRIRMDADNHIQVKVWPFGDTEPGAWTLDYTESGDLITDPGVFQLNTQNRVSGSSTETHYDFVTLEAL